MTFNAQGKPELTMVWMDVDGDELVFNTAEGRRKPDNIRHDPRVIVSVQDRNNPQAYAVFHAFLNLSWQFAVRINSSFLIGFFAGSGQ